MQYSDFLNRRLRCQVIFEVILTPFSLGYLAIFVPEPIGGGRRGGGRFCSPLRISTALKP